MFPDAHAACLEKSTFYIKATSIKRRGLASLRSVHERPTLFMYRSRLLTRTIVCLQHSLFDLVTVEPWAMSPVGQMDNYIPAHYHGLEAQDAQHSQMAQMGNNNMKVEEMSLHGHSQYLCDSNGMKTLVATQGGPGGGGSTGQQVQDPQPSTSHPRDSQAKLGLPNGKKTKGRVKIKMEFIDNKLRRYTTFSKRKTGIMKKAYELSTLTGTQVMLLVASETGHVYTFATRKLQPMITSDTGKDLIQMCLNSPDPPADPHCHANDPRGQPSGFEETDLTYSVDDEKVRAPTSIMFGAAPPLSHATQMSPPLLHHHHHHGAAAAAAAAHHHHHHHQHSGGAGAYHVPPHHIPVHQQQHHHHAQAAYSPQGMVLHAHPGTASPPGAGAGAGALLVHTPSSGGGGGGVSPSSTPSPTAGMGHRLSQSHHISCSGAAQQHLDT
ncbi:unnamed protein product [Notodromas monacha]|uniref:Serum response factor homolog n=1 Tax=Notodromas monacha TaxID=399045 RepID=A0A7R9GHH0_9CRUS|nr:unnamed protein product [Notodromas monacha]CAG0921315.1 unnamed protein product [Notodromas monacha]